MSSLAKREKKMVQDANALLRMQTPSKGGKCKKLRCKGVVPRKPDGECPVCHTIYPRGDFAPR